ncbi:galactan export ABC transporter permease subunit Wzm/RfbD [Gordonia paraffinivorans]|uniref:ABC transporter permease protein n=2 Tax=Gordonia paraffinivorans TaxID=175628 RepID=A0ABQ0IMF9_9ACTN|nr:ABC transporter permease [Gordonia paraffinivorans]MBY4573236.1 sugar ABC transporter permease [Gordonia paraffinivorans]MCD2146976.1 ABC transporter permease [Gordonia paraffinivorans]PWD42296.1 sugar ABC transporter permease [Gordonia paraffinivorans]VFA88728.1 ABC-2 type transporter [Gordonia paraffinivorans]GAC84747.1 putative ABC transporter permease protein [Gordonia paraffinivorans NBRC 108238]
MSAVVDDDAIPARPESSESRTFARAVKDLRDGLASRELWFHLGWQDIKQRYRRSALGPFWITIATAVTATAMGLLYGELFGMDIKVFLPYVTLGFIFWNFIESSILDGSEVFSKNEGLIKQLPAPVSVHVYRVVWRALIIFAHNVAIIVIVFLIFPPPIGWSAFLVVPALVLYMLNSIWVTIVFGILSTRFRDIGQLLTTAVRLVFFMTPIIWTTTSLSNATGETSSRLKLVELNPMFHYLEIARGPLLGQPVEFYHWAVVLGCTAFGWILGMLVMRNYRARVAYWV